MATDLGPPSGGGRIGTQPSADRRKGLAFRALLFVSLGVGLLALVTLIVQVLVEGAPRLGQDLLFHFPSSDPEIAGAQSAIVGTLWLMGIVAATCLPLGIGAALYLEEYANKERWYNRLIEINIQNLAAVPSIVYGILGLAFFVRGFADLGQAVLAGGLTLSLLVLPVVIIAAREAIRSVPDSIRQGSMALGATKWQTIRRQILPASIPGIATGSILALSRAIGEAAPLVLLGALTFITFNPEGLGSAFTALPIQIFNWISRPQEEFKVLAAAAIVVLLAILLAMNATAIWLRNRYQRQW
jgi:phosphate transport system permease protein